MKKIFPNLYSDKNLLIADLNKNNFDCLRFFLATAVIYSHSFAIYYRTMAGNEPVNVFTHNQVDLGSIAVYFFFVISGFLIVKSFESSGSTYEYLIKRILRICPGFFVAFLVSIFIFGVIGTIDISHKFGQWKYYFQHLGGKRTVLEFLTLEAPKSVHSFLTNPLRNQVNEPLWTIQFEFTCYLIVPLVGIISVLKRKWLSLLFFLISYTILILQTVNFITIPDNEQNWVFLYPSELPILLSFFFSGACFYFFRNHIKRNNLLILLALISILFASKWVPGINIALPLAGTYLVFIFVYHPRIQFYDFAKRGDFSYGLYLYGWPVQQLIMYFFAKYLSANYLFFIAFPVSFLMAFLSWHIIENPFLKMKRLLKRRLSVKPEVAIDA